MEDIFSSFIVSWQKLKGNKIKLKKKKYIKSLMDFALRLALITEGSVFCTLSRQFEIAFFDLDIVLQVLAMFLHCLFSQYEIFFRLLSICINLEFRDTKTLRAHSHLNYGAHLAL